MKKLYLVPGVLGSIHLTDGHEETPIKTFMSIDEVVYGLESFLKNKTEHEIHLCFKDENYFEIIKSNIEEHYKHKKGYDNFEVFHEKK